MPEDAYPDSLKSREKFLAFCGSEDSDWGMIRGGFLRAEDRRHLIALARDGSAASRLTNALVLLDDGWSCQARKLFGSLCHQPDACELRDLPECLHQFSHVTFPASVAKFERVSPGKGLEFTWKIFGARHLGSLDKHRNDRDVPTQRRCGFHSYKVVRIIKSPSASFIDTIKPLLADHHDKYIAATYGTVDCLSEVHPGINSRDIHEYVILSEELLQVVKQMKSFTLRIVTPVAQKIPVTSSSYPSHAPVRQVHGQCNAFRP